MSPEQEALARRALSCEGWRWLPGMACLNAAMPDTWCARIGDERKPTFNHYLPDLTDPCTIGGLLALVRAAWDDPAAWAAPDGDWHVFGDMPETEYGIGDTEAAALVAALEAAPSRAGGER